MRLGNALGIQNNQPAAQPYRTPVFPTDSPTESNVSGSISESTGAGVKIERIPSDMGYAEKVLSKKKADEADDDIAMADSEDFYNNNEMNGARKRRRGLGMSWDIGEEGTSSPDTSDKMSDGTRDDLAEESEQLKQLLLESPDLHIDAHQQSRLAMRALAFVPESHRELTEFWMRSASEVDWKKLLKAVSAILKVSVENVLHTLFKTLINEFFYLGGDSNIPLLSIHDVANDLVPDGCHGTARHVHVSY
jgi:hypothetical protein